MQAYLTYRIQTSTALMYCTQHISTPRETPTAKQYWQSADLSHKLKRGSVGNTIGKCALTVRGMVMLHMKELSGWNLLKKQRLITDLCEITQHHVARKFGVVVINRELKAGLSEAERRKWRIQAYSIAGRTAAREVKLWSDSWGGRLPELIFEDGDQGKGNLIHLLTTQGYPQPLFKPKKDCRHKKSGVLIKSAIPLQSADMLSYALFSYCRGWPSTLGQPRLNRFLENIPGEWGTIEEDRFRFIVDGLEQEDSLIATTTVKIKTR